MSKVIITAALNGPTLHRGLCPYVPFEPAEIAAEARRSVDAGAAVLHLHAREEGGAPSYRPERYREVVDAVRATCPEALVSVSTGAYGVTREDRAMPLQGRPDLATLATSSFGFARFNRSTGTFDYDLVFANPFADVIALADEMRGAGIEVVPACMDLGHAAALATLIEAGALERPRLCTVALGHAAGIPPTLHNLCRLADALPEGSAVQVSAVGPTGWRLLAGAVAAGAHVRTGLQDSLVRPAGERALSNGELVTDAAQLIRAVGAQVASPEEARRTFLGG